MKYWERTEAPASRPTPGSTSSSAPPQLQVSYHCRHDATLQGFFSAQVSSGITFVQTNAGPAGVWDVVAVLSGADGTGDVTGDDVVRVRSAADFAGEPGRSRRISICRRTCKAKKRTFSGRSERRVVSVGERRGAREPAINPRGVCDDRDRRAASGPSFWRCYRKWRRAARMPRLRSRLARRWRRVAMTSHPRFSASLLVSSPARSERCSRCRLWRAQRKYADWQDHN